MEYDNWFDTYRPIENHRNHGFDGTLFETYGTDKDIVERIDPKYLWTLVDAEGEWVVLTGRRLVNRIGYFVTLMPWQDEMLEVVVPDGA